MAILSLRLKTFRQATWLHRSERGATCWLSTSRIREFLQTKGLGLGLYVRARLVVRMIEVSRFRLEG